MQEVTALSDLGGASAKLRGRSASCVFAEAAPVCWHKKVSLEQPYTKQSSEITLLQTANKQNYTC